MVWKRICRLLGFFLGLTVLGLGVGIFWLWRWQKNITPAWVIAQVEKNCACRLDLDAVEISLFSRPARLSLKGAWFTPPDESVVKGVAVSHRPRPVRKATYLCVDSAEIHFDLWSWLTQQKLSAEKVALQGVDVRFDIVPEAGLSLAQLFARPEGGVGGVSPELAVLATPAVAHADDGEEPASDSGDPASAPSSPEKESTPVSTTASRPSSLPTWRVPVQVKSLHLSQTRCRIRHLKTKNQYTLEEMDLQVRDFLLDPRANQIRSGAQSQVSGRLTLDSRKKKDLRFVNLSFTSQADWRFLDTQTGQWNVSADGALTIQAGAVAREWPVLQKLKKRLDKAQKAGLKLPDFTASATLAQPAVIDWLWQNHTVQLQQPLVADFGDFALTAQSQALLDLDQESHQLAGTLAFNEKISQQALQEVNLFLEPLGADASESLRELLIQPLVREKQIVLDFESEGRISDPKIKTHDPITDFKDQLKEGKNLLENLLK